MGAQEERYLEIIGRYADTEVRENIPALFGALINDYERHIGATPGAWCDPLGELFEGWKSHKGKSSMGQFFTPPSVCDLCSMVYPETPNKNEVTIADPACGSGRMLLSLSRRSQEWRTAGRYYGTDLDRTCVMMCAVNMFFHGVRGAAIHGNTLQVKAYGGYLVRPDLLRIDFLTAEQAQRYLTAPNEKKNLLGELY